MISAWHHFIRYVCWAAFGIVLLSAIPAILQFVIRGTTFNWGRIMPFVIFLGGGTFVILRALTGVISRWRPSIADRALAVWIRRFFSGWLLGIGVLMVFVVFTDPTPRARRTPSQPLRLPASAVLQYALCGGAAMVLHGWLAKKGWNQWLVLCIWATFFIVFLSGWFAVSEHLPYHIQSYFRSSDPPF